MNKVIKGSSREKIPELVFPMRKRCRGSTPCPGIRGILWAYDEDRSNGLILLTRVRFPGPGWMEVRHTDPLTYRAIVSSPVIINPGEPGEPFDGISCQQEIGQFNA
jgi:hypothetical protein